MFLCRHGTYSIVFLLIRFICTGNIRYQWILEMQEYWARKEELVGIHTSGFGSQRSEQIESNTLEMVNAGDHCERRISRQIAPFELILG